MPQLDPRYFSSQFFWIIVCFALFYACVHFLIVPRLKSILESRAYLNTKNKTTAHMIILQSAELKSISHTKTLEMQQNIDEMKAKFERKFHEYSKGILSEFNDKIKSSYDSVQLEIEKQKKTLNEKTTNEYVLSVADKVVTKLTGVKS